MRPSDSGTDGRRGGRRALLLIGPGNNGADGLVVARHLRRRGAEVCCYVVRGRPAEDPKMSDALAYGVTVLDAADDPDLQALDTQLRHAELVVDAILGAGRYRPLDGVVAAVASLVNRRRRADRRRSVVAVDLPTGVNPDTGAADGQTIAADETLALGFPKFGIANFPGAGYAGRITALDIGLPSEVAAAAHLPTEWMTNAAAAVILPARPPGLAQGHFRPSLDSGRLPQLRRGGVSGGPGSASRGRRAGNSGNA